MVQVSTGLFDYNKTNEINKLLFVSIHKYSNCIDLKKILGEVIMKKYLCTACGYIYDPEAGDPDNGIEPGTAFEDLPDDWICPLCGVGKELFEETD